MRRKRWQRGSGFKGFNSSTHYHLNKIDKEMKSGKRRRQVPTNNFSAIKRRTIIGQNNSEEMTWTPRQKGVLKSWLKISRTTWAIPLKWKNSRRFDDYAKVYFVKQTWKPKLSASRQLNGAITSRIAKVERRFICKNLAAI